jgi:hypothetical protein
VDELIRWLPTVDEPTSVTWSDPSSTASRTPRLSSVAAMSRRRGQRRTRSAAWDSSTPPTSHCHPGWSSLATSGRHATRMSSVNCSTWSGRMQRTSPHRCRHERVAPTVPAPARVTATASARACSLLGKLLHRFPPFPLGHLGQLRPRGVSVDAPWTRAILMAEPRRPRREQSGNFKPRAAGPAGLTLLGYLGETKSWLRDGPKGASAQLERPSKFRP